MMLVLILNRCARGFIPRQTLSIYLLGSLAFMESFKLIIICIKLLIHIHNLTIRLALLSYA